MNEANQPENATRRQRRSEKHRKRWVFWGVLLLVLLAVVATARPVYRWTKTRRANHFVDQAESFLTQGKMAEAASKYRAALQMDPLGYRPLAGAARLATRLDRPEAGDLWHEVMRLPECTTADRQDFAGWLLQRGKTATAEKMIEQLLQNAPDVKTLTLAARYAGRMGNEAKAIEFARLAVTRAPQGDTAAQFLLAEVLARSADPAQRAAARETLWSVAEHDGPGQRAALEAIARAPELSNDEKSRVLAELEKIADPGATTDLLAAELRLQLQPGAEDQIYEQEIARWGKADATALVELTRWLNLHRQFERVLALIPQENAGSTSTLLLSRLDALAGLGRWNEIDAILAGNDLPLDASVVESFRARSAQGRGSALDETLHWDRAIAAAGSDSGKLRFVANFAEQSKASAAALKAYEQLARSADDAVYAQRARQRILETTGDVHAARSAAERLLTAAPDDPNALAQLIHLNLLLGTDVEANAAKAQALVAKYPARLSFRVTAALGYLRQFNAAAALAQFDAPVPIEWQRTPPGWRAVYAAALAADDKQDAAREIIVTIPLDQLKPEERELLPK
ncbi:MAG: hypothetical protein M3Y80_10200 [Verrucomicrobiota bacterium]|nr:hypothetical protein [Verrucomicrobiota bacterium]